jgi:hypothetical protein
VLPVLGAPGSALDRFDDGAMHERPSVALGSRAARRDRTTARAMAVGGGTVSPTTGGADEMAMEAAVRADTQGWIALLDDGRLVASVTDRMSRRPGEAPR